MEKKYDISQSDSYRLRSSTSVGVIVGLVHPVYTIYCEVSGSQNLSKPTVKLFFKRFATSSCDFTKNDMNYPYGETLSIF